MTRNGFRVQFLSPPTSVLPPQQGEEDYGNRIILRPGMTVLLFFGLWALDFGHEKDPAKSLIGTFEPLFPYSEILVDVC